MSSLVSNQILTMLTFLSKKKKKNLLTATICVLCTNGELHVHFSSCMDEELMRKLEVDQSWRFNNQDANVAVSFPFISSMRAKNVSKMVRLVDGRLPNGAISPLS